jgi:hypothetical protein
MSLTVTIIVIVALVVLLFAALAFVMSRPRQLRPHRPSRWRIERLRAGRGHPPRGKG